MNRNIYENISPIDSRYYKSYPDLSEELSRYLSERSSIYYQALVEVALINVLERYSVAPPGSSEEIKNALRNLDPDEVYREEEKTRHNIRALVNVMQRYVNEKVAPYIHLTATSEDITSCANALRIRDAFYRVVIPKTIRLIEVIIEIVEREADTVQIGRTHGQHAVPITVGYVFSGYVNRLGERLQKMLVAVDNLRGKMSGAVGAYNASSLIVEDPRKFEEDVLAELRLKPSAFSSQIVEPEYILDLIHAVVSAFGVLAQISDDMRHLQRTEIGEMGESFEKDQVGSSTMPHKRNPWNFEHVKSMWKEFMPRVITRYMDQISEHQRDLTNSASGRFIVEIIAGYVMCVERLTKQLSKLVVDKKRILENLKATRGMFLAEPLYVLLAYHGIKDAHERVRKLTLRAEKESRSLIELVREDESFKPVLEDKKWKSLEEDFTSYTGKAKERALAISYIWRAKLDEIRGLCQNYKEVNYV